MIPMAKRKIRILVLGSSGMLGSALFRAFSKDPNFDTFGSIRSANIKRHFRTELQSALIDSINLEDEEGLLASFAIAKPDVVINCVGLIKQLPNANDYLQSLAINAMLPHRLAKHCIAINARLIHFSTDCVFSGRKGQYKEGDFPDAHDLYGRTKFLGEVSYDNTITLRTSIVGHELGRAKSLIDWFLGQSAEVKGYTKAVFSGLPTFEIARVVKECILPNRELSGVYHLSVDPINKYDLLNLVSCTYGKDIRIIPDQTVVIDRSLNSDRLRAATGFKPRSWSDMIKDMHNDYLTIH